MRRRSQRPRSQVKASPRGQDSRANLTRIPGTQDSDVSPELPPSKLCFNMTCLDLLDLICFYPCTVGARPRIPMERREWNQCLPDATVPSQCLPDAVHRMTVKVAVPNTVHCTADFEAAWQPDTSSGSVAICRLRLTLLVRITTIRSSPRVFSRHACQGFAPRAEYSVGDPGVWGHLRHVRPSHHVCHAARLLRQPKEDAIALRH